MQKIIHLSSLPQNWLSRLALKQAARNSQVVADTRTVQYRLLMELGIRADYIPEPYQPTFAPLIAPKLFGARKGDYTAVVASLEVFNKIKKIYKAVNTKKPLIQVDFADSRKSRSIVAQAGLVVLASPRASRQLVLESLESGRAVVAVNDSVYQEILGTCAQFFALEDFEQLEKILIKSVKDRKLQARWGKKATKRAVHFSATRVQAEMKKVMASQTRLVSVDSARALAQTAV